MNGKESVAEDKLTCIILKIERKNNGAKHTPYYLTNGCVIETCRMERGRIIYNTKNDSRKYF